MGLEETVAAIRSRLQSFYAQNPITFLLMTIITTILVEQNLLAIMLAY